jgi:hypothetical protein
VCSRQAVNKIFSDKKSVYGNNWFSQKLEGAGV